MRYLDEIVQNAANSNDKFCNNDMILLQNVEKIEKELRTIKKLKYPRNIAISDKVVMAELFIRLHGNYSTAENQNWLIEFFKVSKFDLLYYPSPAQIY